MASVNPRPWPWQRGLFSIVTGGLVCSIILQVMASIERTGGFVHEFIRDEH